ncbi:MAG: hypothetical protein QF886_23615, partial [Planctomycetota bacterium]|nr:hypothetical protein [Planctomycetota bacterium]
MSGSGGYGKLYRDLGYHPADEVNEAGFLELIGGKIYADAERSALMFWNEMPFSYNLDQVLSDPKLIETAPAFLNPERVDGMFLFRLPGFIRDTFRSRKKMNEGREEAADEFHTQAIPRFVKWVATKYEQDLSELNSSQLLDELQDRMDFVLDDFACATLKPGFHGGAAYISLEEILVQLLGEADGKQTAMTLCLGL